MLAEKLGLTKDFRKNFESYFTNKTNEVKRIEAWTNIMNYLQFYIDKPENCRLRIIKSKENYPLVIIKRGEKKLMIPIITGRPVSLKLNTFKEIGIEPGILELFSDISGLCFKLYNDDYYYKKPRTFKSKNS